MPPSMRGRHHVRVGHIATRWPGVGTHHREGWRWRGTASHARMLVPQVGPIRRVVGRTGVRRYTHGTRARWRVIPRGRCNRPVATTCIQHGAAGREQILILFLLRCECGTLRSV
uniref:Uncharacterized protein n=1 Tax=Cacopsylla melanoneura TaxID=428564 RepID=A0A8D8SJN6_9HEMI